MLEAISPELPLHMRRYSLYRGRLLGIDLVFATVNQDEQSSSEYAQMALLFRRELSLPVVFVFQSLPSAKRNSLIRHGVPFVVPKWQLFLPPNLHLNERAPQTGVVRKSMRPATQAVVIRQLVRGDCIVRAGDSGSSRFQRLAGGCPLQGSWEGTMGHGVSLSGFARPVCCA